MECKKVSLFSHHYPNSNPKKQSRNPQPLSLFQCQILDLEKPLIPQKGDLHFPPFLLKIVVADMPLFSGNPSPSILLQVALALLFISLLPAAVRSDPNFLKLPSEYDEICPLNSHQDHDMCPVNCFRPNPVCGADGVTYWCGCAEANCAGVRVKKLGYCEVGNGGSGPAGQALLLVHIIWLVLLGIFVLFGLL